MSDEKSSKTIPTGLGVAILVSGSVLVVLLLLLISLPTGHSALSGNETRVASLLKQLATAQLQYQAISPNNSFAPNLLQLNDADFLQGIPLVERKELNGEKSGYRYSMEVSDFRCPAESEGSQLRKVSGSESPDTVGVSNFCKPAPGFLCVTHNQPGAWHRFSVQAHPEVYGETGRRSFHIDQEGLLVAADLEGRNAGDWLEHSQE